MRCVLEQLPVPMAPLGIACATLTHYFLEAPSLVCLVQAINCLSTTSSMRALSTSCLCTLVSLLTVPALTCSQITLCSRTSHMCDLRFVVTFRY